MEELYLKRTVRVKGIVPFTYRNLKYPFYYLNRLRYAQYFDNQSSNKVIAECRTSVYEQKLNVQKQYIDMVSIECHVLVEYWMSNISSPGKSLHVDYLNWLRDTWEGYSERYDVTDQDKYSILTFKEYAINDITL